MRNGTDKRGKKLAAIAAAAAVLVFLLFYAGFPLAVLWGLASEETVARLASLPMAVFAALTAAVIVGVAAALCQRLREIEKGEEDEAKKY